MAVDRGVDAKGAMNGKKDRKGKQSRQHFCFALSTQHSAQIFRRSPLDLSASFPETHPDRDPLRIIFAAQVQ